MLTKFGIREQMSSAAKPTTLKTGKATLYDLLRMFKVRFLIMHRVEKS
jgi:hypothetical protein